MSSIFIDPSDLALLTGISKAKNQPNAEVNKARCAWLRKQRIPFHLNARDEPIVPRAVVEFQTAILPAVQEWKSAKE